MFFWYANDASVIIILKVFIVYLYVTQTFLVTQKQLNYPQQNLYIPSLQE